MSEKRTYYDEINDITILFYSNASQSIIDALLVNGMMLKRFYWSLDIE